MAKQTCPNCGVTFSTNTGWANAAISTLIAAPAVPDMASQVRCPECQHLITNSELRYLSASSSGPRYVVVAMVAMVVLGWAVYQLFQL